MSAQERVTLTDVRHVAALANLELTAAEEPAMERDLNAVLGYIAELNELETAGVEPMAQVSQIVPLPALPSDLHDGSGASHDVRNPSLRNDRVQPSVDRGLVLAEAPETDGRFFKVPKVIER